jgi:hypothetical protein
MTKNEFTDLELSKDISAMSEEEAKETLSDFMEAHQTNRTVYDELQTELTETEAEYTEKLEAKEERIAEFREDKAKEAAEHVELPADLIAERFEYSEIVQIIDEAEEAETEYSEDETEEDEDENLTTFAQREEKGKADKGSNTARFREQAETALQSQGFPAKED